MLVAPLLSVLLAIVLILSLLLSVLLLLVLVLPLLLLSVLLSIVLVLSLLLSVLLLLVSGPAAVVAGHAAVAVEHAAGRVLLARAYSVAVGGGLAFRPAARAVHKQEQRFREAKTEWLCWIYLTAFIRVTSVPSNACPCSIASFQSSR